jgi:hypothetical protein
LQFWADYFADFVGMSNVGPRSTLADVFAFIGKCALNGDPLKQYILDQWKFMRACTLNPTISALFGSNPGSVLVTDLEQAFRKASEILKK